MKSNLLTNSRLSTLRTCPRKHFYRYELGIDRTRASDALRFGAAYHKGLEHYGKHLDDGAAIADATASYDVRPQWADETEWQIEREQVSRLLAGHFWRYSNDEIAWVSVEKSFELPLVNPGTNAASRTFLLAGKIDSIVKLADGRLAVLEYKTTSEDISPESDYWNRLRCDPQITMYVLAARELGFNVETVLYDVTRKPTINPAWLTQKDTAAFIESGEYSGEKFEIALDGAQPVGEWTVATVNGVKAQLEIGKKGFAIRETVEMYAARLLSDIGTRPDHYYARREIPRLESDLDELRVELWQQAQQLREAQKAGRWFRNVSRMTCGHCQFAGLCLQSVVVNVASPPAGFETLENVHPELAGGEE